MIYSGNRQVVPFTNTIEKNGVYKVKLIEDNKLPVSDQEITITINSQTYTNYTNDQGVAQFKLNITPGTYPVTSSYGSSSVVKNLNIVAQSNAAETKIVPLNYALWNGNQLQVKLINMNTGTGIANKNIKITYNGIDHTVSTNNNGIGSLTISGLNSGVYSAILNYDGNDYKPSSNYTVFYIGNNSYDSHYNYIPHGNYIVTTQDWIDYTYYKNLKYSNVNSPTIDTVNDDYVIRLSNHLNKYDNVLEDIISMNSYVASTQYIDYSGHLKSTVDTISSFSGNCVDETNVFVSLSRVNNLPTRYIHAEYSNGEGHMFGQVLINEIWITFDQSVVNSASDLRKNSAARQLGNKGYLLNSLDFKLSGIFCCENNLVYGFDFSTSY